MDKRGFLFTVITFVLLMSVMLLAKAYMYRDQGLRESATSYQSSSRIGMIEEDIISNVFNDLLTVSLQSITRTTTLTVIFNRSELTAARNYPAIMQNYKNYIENTYASQNYINLALNGFNNTFVIQPYGTRFEIVGQTLYLYFASPYTDISAISVSAQTDSEKQGSCKAPSTSGAIPITVTYRDTTGYTCTNTVSLSATADNDKTGQQFELSLKNPSGDVDTKFGQVGGINGVLAILPTTANFNITQLSITYTLPASRVYLESGTLGITSRVNNLTKSSKIILAQE
jgi:hypothetical protein